MKTILVVDDQPEVRQLVGLSIGETRYRIRYAGDGESALLQARIEIPDLVILDLMMPGSPDGFGVCWKLKSDRRFEHTKVLILSGQEVKGSHLVCESFGADGFLVKPFSPSELSTRVEELLYDTPSDEDTVRQRVLVVDDQPDLRNLVRITLGNERYEIAEAPNGREALEIVESFRPQVVVLDVMMPGGLSGHDVCRAVKEDETSAGTQILMLTALADQSQRQAATRVGADDFMAKPFSPLELIDRVERLANPANNNAMRGSQ